LNDEEGINKRLDELDALLKNTKYAKQKGTLKDVKTFERQMDMRWTNP
jgi:hypothetical protein